MAQSTDSSGSDPAPALPTSLAAIPIQLRRGARNTFIRNERREFFCYSNIQKVWSDEHIRIIVPSEDTQRMKAVKDNLLQFLSFVACVEYNEEWFRDCENKLFKSDESLDTIFKDTDMPLHPDFLLELGLPECFDRDWKQHEFAPQRLNFSQGRENSKPVMLAPDAILPFVETPTSKTQGGGFGDVYVCGG